MSIRLSTNNKIEQAPSIIHADGAFVWIITINNNPMRRKVSTVIGILLISLLSTAPCLQAQSTKSDKQKSISLDSLSYIQIDKVIYYQTPVETYLGKLTSDQYEPDWYNAYCANMNADRFKSNPQEVLKYLHKSINLSDSDKVNIIKHPVNYSSMMPYSYFFGEVRLTHKGTGEKIIIVLAKDNETRLNDFTLKLPEKKNSPIEKLDSVKMQAIHWNLYVEQNGVVKLANTRYVDSLLSNNSEYFIKSNLDDFKNMLYRRRTYIASIKEKNRRKFNTMEKGKSGHQKVQESDMP